MDFKEFGKLRKEQNISQTILCKYISRATLSSLENEKYIFTYTHKII